ncbi:hypothetical protein LCGC14_2090190 [marine sediment metagenome]|uniref:Uncharacterized protein n=1 Tax=marine sediment metagenome TaxID=412755 RepID=A0A0F9GR57_9ZZZZ
MNRHLYKDCKTGREVVARAKFIELQMNRDITNAKEAHDNYFIHKLIQYYNMPYEKAAREFYKNGMTRMGLGI